MTTGNRIPRSFKMAMKRGKWLGDAAARLWKAIEEKNETLFDQTYTETMEQLRWKFREARQLSLPLHEHGHHKQHSITQLRLFAA